MAQYQNFSFEPPSRLEAAAQHADEKKGNCHHRPGSCSDSVLVATPAEFSEATGQPDFKGRDKSAEIPSKPKLVSVETTAPTAEPTNSRPFDRPREISATVRLRGGPGRTRTSNQAVMSR